jgi:hypothetical protein
MIGIAAGSSAASPIAISPSGRPHRRRRLPRTRPERPRGLERNVVVTVRDWSNEKVYMHDLSSTDRRDPTVNGYGKIYGAPELSTDDFPILDPVANESRRASTYRCATPIRRRRPRRRRWRRRRTGARERIWDSQANAHNPMFDQHGRVWYTARIRGPENPAFCREGSDHPSAKLFPEGENRPAPRGLRPGDGEYTFIDTCFSTHHLQFA